VAQWFNAPALASKWSVDRISPRPKLFNVDTEFYQPFVFIKYSKLALRKHAEKTIERIFAFRGKEAQGRIQRRISGRGGQNANGRQTDAPTGSNVAAMTS